jgi:hypothetical protein
MNERIRELMDESVRFRLDPDSKQYEAQVSPEELEMFAELIVRECNSKLDNIGVIDRDSRTIAMKVISEHFGVEQ